MTPELSWIMSSMDRHGTQRYEQLRPDTAVLCEVACTHMQHTIHEMVTRQFRSAVSATPVWGRHRNETRTGQGRSGAGLHLITSRGCPGHECHTEHIQTPSKPCMSSAAGFDVVTVTAQSDICSCLVVVCSLIHELPDKSAHSRTCVNPHTPLSEHHLAEEETTSMPGTVLL